MRLIKNIITKRASAFIFLVLLTFIFNVDLVFAYPIVNVTPYTENSTTCVFKVSYEPTSVPDGYRLGYAINPSKPGSWGMSIFFSVKKDRTKVIYMQVWALKTVYDETKHIFEIVTLNGANCDIADRTQTGNPVDPPPSFPPQVGEITGLKYTIYDGYPVLHWNPYPNADSYKIYENGNLFTIVGGQWDNYTVFGGNEYQIKAYDSNGNLIGVSNVISTPPENQPIQNAELIDGQLYFDPVPGAYGYQVDGEVVYQNFTPVREIKNEYILSAIDGDGNPFSTTTTSGTGSGDGGTCGDACQKLADMMACPEWETYMSEWEDTIRRAIPPPPNWNQVANIFRDSIVPRLISDLSNLLGTAPSPPSQQEIGNRIQQPQPTADLQVDLPEAENPFSGVQEFDISDYEEIEIVNESPNFEFNDPTDIDHTAPRTPIYPNDPANHTGGIKTPTVDYDPPPTPTHVPEGLPDLPNDPVPTPDPNYNPTPSPANPNLGTAEPADRQYDTPYYKEQP